jgi:type I restriction enzyme S subunit
MTRRLVTLGEVCSQDRTSVRPGHADELAYLGLEGIESGTGRFLDGELSKTPEVPQANSFRFDERHVLYGKLRPYLNKVAVPTAPGKCSTEIIPLLPCAQLDRKYLSYFLRAPAMVKKVAERSSGARMPRADMDFVLSLPISLPAMEEQRRTVDLLARAEGIVRLRREAQQKAAELIPAVFVDMFGDPATNPKGWPVVPLGEVIKRGPSNGLYKHRSAYGAGTPILRIDGFYDGVITGLSQLKRVQLEDEDELRRFALVEGDIVVNRVNSPEYLGKSAIVPHLAEATVFESNMMRFGVDGSRMLPEFVIALLQQPASRLHLLANAKHAINQSSINQQDVKSVPVPLPPVALQQAFAQRIAAVDSIRGQQAEATSTAQASFDALLASAFRGT